MMFYVSVSGVLDLCFSGSHMCRLAQFQLSLSVRCYVIDRIEREIADT